MKNISISLLFAFFLVLASCNADFDYRDYLNVKSKWDESMSLNSLKKGIKIRIAKRFTSGYVLLKGQPINSFFRVDTANHQLFVKLNAVGAASVKPGDTLRLVLRDDDPTIKKYAAVKVVDVYIDPIKPPRVVTPCDSVSHIIYESIAGNMDKMTAEKVQLIQLYNKVLDDKIQSYLRSLRGEEARQSRLCVTNFKLLDWIKSGQRSGFSKKRYFLNAQIKDYLNTIAEGISYEVNSRKWDRKKFVIKCVGYADERDLRSKETIRFDSMGLEPDRRPQPIYFDQNGCGVNGTFFRLDSAYAQNFRLYDVHDNCSLSLVRAFVSVLYLRDRLKALTNNEIGYEYSAGGVSRGDWDANRKIDLQIQLKAGAKF